MCSLCEEYLRGIDPAPKERAGEQPPAATRIPGPSTRDRVPQRRRAHTRRAAP